MAINNGGPALPWSKKTSLSFSKDGESANPVEVGPQQGMSLRAWLVGQALSGMLAGWFSDADSAGAMQDVASAHGTTFEDYAGQLACDIADAAIARLQKDTDDGNDKND